MAVSSTQSQDYGGAITTHVTRSESHLPLLSATCPALVCLVEKSHPSIVPHLSTTKSPMAMAGSYIKHSSSGGNSINEILHIAIMPCHDKKLEASRKDFASVEEIPDVDLVLTSNEWIELIKSQASDDVSGGDSTSNDVDTMRTYIESLEPAMSVSSLQQQRNGNEVVLVESPAASGSDEAAMEIDDDSKAANADFFAYGSGGYADFIFRYAAKNLFGVDIQEAHLPWKAVAASSGTGPKVVSARVAASRKKDYHAVSLYKLQDGTYSMTAADGASTPVLRFATAYGFQTLQRILQPMDSSNGSLEFDYVEAMACPSGCVNGGGQVRVMERETPKETRQRVSETKERFEVSYQHAMSSCSNNDVYREGGCGDGPFGPKAQVRLHTRYHVVPPLQHTLGAAAGVAVQDTQW
jgi:iron only hydrogenase large subunit-like protein